MRAATLPDIVCRRGADGTAVVEGIRQAWVWHSPTGFEWGYGGSGPADLALNILLAATADRDFAARPSPPKLQVALRGLVASQWRHHPGRRRPRLDRGTRFRPTLEGDPIMTTMDWNGPAAVKRFQHRTILKLAGLPVLCGLLAAAAWIQAGPLASLDRSFASRPDIQSGCYHKPPDFTRRPGASRFIAPHQNRASFNRQ